MVFRHAAWIRPPGEAMLAARHLTALLVAASLSGAVAADYSTDQIEMAANGRFDLLESSVEEYARTHPLTTRDQHTLCYAYSKTKRYTRLLACLEQLEEKVRGGDRRTRLFGLSDATPSVHVMRADALIDLGRYREAIDAATKAVTWLKEDNSTDVDLLFSALAALSLARTLGGDDAGGWEAEKELRAFDPGLFSDYVNAQAFALARARMGLKDYRGVIEAIQGDTSFAVKVFLDRLVSGGYLTGINNWAWAELPRAFMLNKALLESGQVSEAKEGFGRLLGIRQVEQNGEIYWLLLADCGRIAENEGQLEEALSYYRRAIEVVETQRASINTEASKIGFVGDKQTLYSRVVDLAQRLDRPLLAFEYMERSKSRALIDLLAARADTQPLTARDSNTQQLLDQFRKAEETAGVQLPLNMASTEPTNSRLLVSAQAKELQARDPALASLVAVTGRAADEMRRHLRPDEALLEFFGSGDNLYGLAMNGTDSRVLPLDAKQVQADTREFRALIERQSPRTAQLASRLYQHLIQPFEALIGGRNLLLVPHGTLHYLPFAALLDGTDSALIARRSLRFLPSTSVQEYLRPQRKHALDNLLILGNPALDDQQYDLPAAEREAKVLAALLPRSEILIRQAASETAFKKLAGSFRYLHIASHGEFNSDGALDSRLLLARDDQNDGSLTVRELYDLRLDAALVTLSACETGLGQAMGGDDLVGLTRGFLYAGSNNIVASLWAVSDEETALLMKGFYRRLKIGTSKKEALRQAQLELQKTYPHPFFWAAFYLTGDGI
jgi:CHAT domain-containing protein